MQCEFCDNKASLEFVGDMLHILCYECLQSSRSEYQAAVDEVKTMEKLMHWGKL
jgi:hypothetical protein